MKVPITQKIVPLFFSAIFLAGSVGITFDAHGQDGSPDLYLPPRLDVDESEFLDTPEEDEYLIHNDYFEAEQQYYEDPATIEEDTSSVSMLTFNFLFYIVYKLKFSNGEEQEVSNSSKTADD